MDRATGVWGRRVLKALYETTHYDSRDIWCQCYRNLEDGEEEPCSYVHWIPAITFGKRSPVIVNERLAFMTRNLPEQSTNSSSYRYHCQPGKRSNVHGHIELLRDLLEAQ